MNSSFNHLPYPEMKQIVAVLVAQLPDGKLETALFETNSGPVAIERRGNHFFISGAWRKAGPEIVLARVMMLNAQKSEQVNRLLLFVPLASSSESRSIKKEWLNQIRQFQLKTGRRKSFELQVWDAQVVREQIRRFPPLELGYFPDDVPDGRFRLKRIEAARRSYRSGAARCTGGSSSSACRSTKKKRPPQWNWSLFTSPSASLAKRPMSPIPRPRVDPLRLLAPGERHVILGDPGSGKSTLLKFLAIAGHDESLRKRYQIEADDRLPILVILRELAEAI